MRKQIQVLVLDDEAIVCERLKEYLEKKGILVETFTDSVKALEKLKETEGKDSFKYSEVGARLSDYSLLIILMIS